mgnify:CR=1 FL=1
MTCDDDVLESPLVVFESFETLGTELVLLTDTL